MTPKIATETLALAMAYDLKQVVAQLDFLQDMLRESGWEFAEEQARVSKEVLKTWVNEVFQHLE